MPMEKIKSGRILVIEAEGATEVRTVEGEDTGMRARAVHEYEPGEVLNPGDELEESPTFAIHWSRMHPEGGGGRAQLSVSLPRHVVDRWLATLDKMGSDEPVEFYSDELTRADLNRLITLGRHVRDSAHGKDA